MPSMLPPPEFQNRRSPKWQRASVRSGVSLVKDQFISDFKSYRLGVRKKATENVQEAITLVRSSEKEIQESETDKNAEYQGRRAYLKEKLTEKLSINESLSLVEMYQRPFEVKDFNVRV